MAIMVGAVVSCGGDNDDDDDDDDDECQVNCRLKFRKLTLQSK